MNIQEFIKKLFTWNEKQKLVCSTLANLNSVVKIPCREDFCHDAFRLEQIDLYKNEYIEILKQNKTLTSTDFMSLEFHNFKNMYIDLMLNLCMEDHTDVSFERIDSVSDFQNEYTNIMITIMKLKLYQEEMDKLIEQTRLKLVALQDMITEISNGRLFVRARLKEKISLLLSEMNSLHSSFVVLLNQKSAMKIEMDAYLSEIGDLDNRYHDEDDEFLTHRICELKRSMKLLLPERLEYLESLDLSSKLFLVKMEQELEIYVYTHLDMMNSLKDELQKLKYEVERKISFDFQEKSLSFESYEDVVRKNKTEYLERVCNLELLYKTCSQCKRNLVYKKDLEELYAIKFKILTLDIYTDEYFDILKNATFTELECYQDIVFQKIENILKGRNRCINDFTPSSFTQYNLIQSITAILKAGEKNFSMWDILNDRKRFAFLLSFDKQGGIEEFLNQFICYGDEYNNLNYYSDYFTWDDHLPIGTIFRIMKCNLETGEENRMEPDLLYNFYVASDKSNDSDIYYIPDGVCDIKVPIGGVSDDYFESSDVIFNYIQSLMEGKSVVMPKSLKSINGSLLKGVSLQQVLLNEGLLCLGECSLENTTIKHITLPSSLECISEIALQWSQLETISIKDMSDAIFMNQMLPILEECYYALRTKMTRYYFASEENKRRQSLYWSGSYSCFDTSYLYDRDTSYTTYQLIPTFDKLIFLENSEEFVFTKEDLTCLIERNDHGYYSVSMPDDVLRPAECTVVMRKLQEAFASVKVKEDTEKIKSYTLKISD